MYNKTLKFYSEDSNLSVQYIKNILPLLGNLKEFEIFRYEKDSPYKSAEENKIYTLILKDDRDNEVWLGNACSWYEGSGPLASIKILKIFGVYNHFDITKKDHVKVVNPKIIHKFNILVDTISQETKRNVQHFWIATSFKYPYELLKVKEALSYMGLWCCVKQKKLSIPKTLKKYEQKKDWDEFFINTEYVLNLHYEENDLPALKKIIIDIIVKNNGYYEIIDL
ncbi:hypothetical protein [Clostridium fungisolvens]|uniref:Uncharacterized protein n=1 Tax=Clostridium fungisolvens TaxID=1604897 RepID=A0A6V8SGB2_9CLOT|nr:hypothetical protein [Clostridium fungisolvens]GFP76254.1 hypothetical protein bsdtw1_02355 [Clostridium fungisolvens]